MTAPLQIPDIHQVYDPNIGIRDTIRDTYRETYSAIADGLGVPAHMFNPDSVINPLLNRNSHIYDSAQVIGDYTRQGNGAAEWMTGGGWAGGGWAGGGWATDNKIAVNTEPHTALHACVWVIWDKREDKFVDIRDGKMTRDPFSTKLRFATQESAEQCCEAWDPAGSLVAAQIRNTWYKLSALAVEPDSPVIGGYRLTYEVSFVAIKHGIGYWVVEHIGNQPPTRMGQPLQLADVDAACAFISLLTNPGLKHTVFVIENGQSREADMVVTNVIKTAHSSRYCSLSVPATASTPCATRPDRIIDLD